MSYNDIELGVIAMSSINLLYLSIHAHTFAFLYTNIRVRGTWRLLLIMPVLFLLLLEVS